MNWTETDDRMDANTFGGVLKWKNNIPEEYIVEKQHPWRIHYHSVSIALGIFCFRFLRGLGETLLWTSISQSLL